MSFIFFVGGVRSGKSRLARMWAEAAASTQLLLSIPGANAISGDNRPRPSKDARGSSWSVIEDPLEPLNRLKLFRQQYPDYNGSLVLDSVGNWIGNLMQQNVPGAMILKRIVNLALMFNELAIPCAIVSGESGAIPQFTTAIGRKYADLLGLGNQILAKRSHCAILISCGLPLVLKGSSPAILDRGLRMSS